MRKAISKALLAAGVFAMLLLPGAVHGSGARGDKQDLTTPDTFDTLSTERKQELRAQYDSLRRAFRLDTVSRQGGKHVGGRIMMRKHEPDGDWTMYRAEPWDGKSQISLDRIYKHTPEQEDAFVRAMIRSMVSEMSDTARREELKRAFIRDLRRGSVPYLRYQDSLRANIDRDNPACDSIYHYQDSVYKHMKTLTRYRDSIYDHLLEIDVDSL